jgi:Flp pilus assembly protein TadG
MVLFTLMLPAVLIPLVGLAIDGSRLYIVQAKLSSAVDGAALGSGRLLGTDANTTEIAGEFLDANFPTGFWGTTNLTPNITYTSSFTAHTITISATVNVPLLFMWIFGWNHSTVASSAVATRKETRVEMVIDRSGSMSELSSVIQTATQFTESFISGYDELGLVAFASSGVVGYPTTRPYNYSPTSSGGPDTNFETTQTNGNMLTMLGDIGSNGYTNMSDGLSLAYIELQKANNRDQDPTRLNAIVLFTDGVPNAFSSYANDPSNNSLLSTSKCTNNPATAGTASTQMIGVAEGYQDSSKPTGLYILASSPTDTNSTAYWMALTNSPNETIGTGNLKSAVAGCTYLDPSSGAPNLGDLKQIPPKTYWGDSTSDGTVSKNSSIYGSLTYKSTEPNVRSNVALAGWNATDNAAQRILADTTLNVSIYVIGYTGQNGNPDTYLLKRLANTTDSSNYNASWQTGQYIAASDGASLAQAFQTVASAILRLAQ